MRKHGHTAGRSMTKVYKAYDNLKTRVLCPKHTSHIYYKDLEIEQDFLDDFNKFYAEIGNPPSDKHTLDRIDNTKGYIYGNIKWSTWIEQAANRRKLGTVKKPPNKVKDISGQKFGRWEVLFFSHIDRDAYFWCRCRCGEVKTVQGRSLRAGTSLSCGCFRADCARIKAERRQYERTCGE